MQTTLRLLIILAATALLAACGGGGGGSNDSASTPDLPAVGVTAFVTTTDFQSASYSNVNLRDQTVRPDLPTQGGIIEADHNAVYYNDKVYIINRLGFDNITVVRTADPGVAVKQFSTGNGTNPQDMAFVHDGKAYVSLYASNDLLIVDPFAADGEEITGRIDLSPFADNDRDGIVEASSMAMVGRYLFVALQRLDTTQATFSPSQGGVLAVIDTETDSLVDADPARPGLNPVLLVGSNPTSVHYAKDLGRLLVSEPGVFQVQDGGLESVNPFTFRTEGFLLTERQLGGDVGAATVAGGSKGYLVVGGFAANRVAIFDIGFDPESGKLQASEDGDLGVSLPFIPDLAIDGGKRLLLPDRTLTAPGVRIYDSLDDAELSDGPIDVGLPPNTILLTPPQPPVAFVTTTDFESATYSLVDLQTGSANIDLPAEPGIIETDNSAVYYHDHVYIINRLGFDNISVLDSTTLRREVKQFSTGNGSNPQDMAFDTDRHAYISLYNSNDLLIVDPFAADGEEITGRIDLSVFRDGASLVNAGPMAMVGRYLFVALQRLDNFNVVRDGVLAVIDTQTDELVDIDPGSDDIDPIVLSRRNPTALRYVPELGRLLVSETGRFGQNDGGIEAVDPFTYSVEGIILEENDIGGDVGDLVAIGGTKGFVVKGGFDRNRVSVFQLVLDIETGLVDAEGPHDLVAMDSPFIPSLAVDGAKRLLVADRTLNSPGVRVFNSFTEQEVTNFPIGVGQPPNKILVLFQP